jgi:hypothetical protein
MAKYKLGDIVCYSYRHDIFALYLILDVAGDCYQMCTLDYSIEQPMGMLYDLFLNSIEDLDNNIRVDYAFDNKKTNLIKKCMCPITELVNFGCKCGGA